MNVCETETDPTEMDQFVLTRENLEQIRAYIKDVQSITMEAGGALGYLEKEYPYLPAITTLSKMRMQVNEWILLEKRICEVCNGFFVYGQETEKAAEEILEKIGKMSILQRTGTALKTNTAEEIKYLLTSILREGDKCQKRTNRLQRDIEKYRSVLEAEIIPGFTEVCSKIQSIPPLDITVKRDGKDYPIFIEKGGFMKASPAVQNFISNFSTYDSEEKALESIDRLKKWEEPLIGEMVRSFTKIGDFRAGINDILDRVRRLEIAWNVVISHTQAVLKEWEAVDGQESMMKFQNHIRLFINHCHQAQQYVDGFYKLFSQKTENK